jgi:ankyrin repeat protein
LNVVDFFLSDEKLKTRFDPANRDCIALKFACRLRHWEIVARLLDDKRTDPRVEQNLALKETIQHNQNALAMRILRYKNANPNDEVLDVACSSGNVEMVVALMERPSINPSARNNRVVLTAVREHQSAIAVFLINDRRVDVTRNDHELFNLACSKNDVAVVAAILKKTKVISYDIIYTKLSIAFSNNDAELAKLLVLEVTIRNKIPLKPEDAKTLIVIACFYNDAILFDICYEQLGVDPFSDNDFSPLLAAIEHGSEKIVERLLKDARSFRAHDPEGHALRKAFDHQSESIAQMLVAHPVFFHRIVALQTAEFYMQRGDTFFVQFLLEHPDIRDALDVYSGAVTLVERNHLDMINLLMQHNILDPSIHDNELLMCAVQNLHHNIVDRFLRDPRVDPTARGGHAMSLAIGLNDRQMLAMLRTAIRKRNRRKFEEEIRGHVVKVDDDDDDDDSDVSANEDLLVMRKKLKLV